MVITRLETQKKNPSRVSMFVDGVFFCGITATTIASENLYVKKEVSEELLDRVIKKEIFNRFFDKALSYLAGSMKSKKQVLTKLKEVAYKKKGDWFKEDVYEEVLSIIDNVVQKLEDMKYLNDMEFAKLFVQSRNTNRPRSKKQLVQELYQKGVDKEIIDEVLEDFSDTDNIKNIYLKKYGNTPLDLNDTKKVGFLARKGFSYDDITKLARQLKDDSTEY